MQCNQCKKEIDVDRWAYCPGCGGSLQDERLISTFHNFFHSRRNVVILSVVVFLFLVGFVFTLLSYQSRLYQKNQRIKSLVKKSEVLVDWDLQTKILPLTYYGENRRLIDLKVDSPAFGSLKITSKIEGLTEAESKTIQIKPESKIYHIAPEITESGLGNLTDSRKAEVEFSVDFLADDGSIKRLIDDRQEVTFFARNDIIWQQEGVFNGKYVVRLINKDRPEIKELVRKSADHVKAMGGKVDGMVGGLGGREETIAQLKAIFLAMSDDYQIKYVLAPFSYDNSAIQKLKSPEEVIQTKSGLCIELAMLAAAALENIGLNPVIITTTGHAWVGVEHVAQSGDITFLETTALDKTPAEAVKIGQDSWDEIKETPDYRLIRVSEARGEGILPMKY